MLNASSIFSTKLSLRSLSSFQVSRDSNGISHLFFADDCLIFYKANSIEWSSLLFLLDKYEIASGQKLNKEKTSIFFNRNTPREIKDNILHISGTQARGSFEKYLGLPTLIGKSKSQAFQLFLTKRRVQSQTGKLNFY